ncbi:thiamine biosynthesis protein ThiI [Alkalihalophilus pseudofirmus OF4]|uniref:Probable tRNA sulfurtransferase n=1 Tax=Alkalihalophilus pseudofirmus (strain ATCC BAA-2126 / JCM 17055 / OF4) TaxID=398511 RepID=D3FX22_ALKPO|nr:MULTISPECIES: tRNA uracil 4-sulfurtransferase ThiI [Alkalihalophilus]ADC48777.1 thiamine biosynthesis protein ThiI [Alkalihalophilus pseudofirmus OF4]MED1600256.1 tRNA 4-thiouridine(8) synthase ThiI [Alkalihalophilus marmarensis]OLS39774.1 tRNA 4-thiouridine(8) synthase ThiI [Alkalihalophilus pseudofirmus]WEG16241.1 tRNA 4-thiouridine(8) synthase ThiI [Alkalihalophilus pseudofirmus]
MEYNHILIRFGELALKGKNRSFFEKQLLQNMKFTLKGLSNLTFKRTYGRIVIELNGENHEPVMEKLSNIFGIHSFSLALKVENDVDEMKKAALGILKEQQAAEGIKTFKITSKRAYKPFPIDSQQLNQMIGGYVLSQSEDISVDVHNPDLDIRVEVRETATYLTFGQYPGAGGLPVGTGGKVLLMLSGGIDSPVAGYLTMKRGARIEAVHFHSPPYTNERALQKVKDLAQTLTKYGSSIRLHLVPFTEIQQYLHKEAPSNYQMTLMRRMMLRISERIARERDILAIASGESLGQVASQTLHSMNTINEVTNLPIIRPLITMDKLEVIDIAKKIDTFETSILPFEDCCTIFLPSDSKTRPKREHANKFEKYLEFDKYVNDAVERTESVQITSVSKAEKDMEDLF